MYREFPAAPILTTTIEPTETVQVYGVDDDAITDMYGRVDPPPKPLASNHLNEHRPSG